MKNLIGKDYDVYWPWAKKLRWFMNLIPEGFTSRSDITRILINHDQDHGYTHKDKRTMENKTAAVFKNYYDRGQMERIEVDGVLKYRFITKE